MMCLERAQHPRIENERDVTKENSTPSKNTEKKLQLTNYDIN